MFSTVDTMPGYYQLPLAEDSEMCTAFSAGSGKLYKFNRMPFGYTGSGGFFQTSVENVLADILLLCCCLPTPRTLASGGVRCSRLWSTSQLLRPSGQQCSHSGGVCPQIQGRQCGAYVGAVEEMMCVVCVDVTEGA